MTTAAIVLTIISITVGVAGIGVGVAEGAISRNQATKQFDESMQHADEQFDASVRMTQEAEDRAVERAQAQDAESWIATENYGQRTERRQRRTRAAGVYGRPYRGGHKLRDD